MNNRRSDNKYGKLLYNPNQREQRRLGAFSNDEFDEDEINEETNENDEKLESNDNQETANVNENNENVESAPSTPSNTLAKEGLKTGAKSLGKQAAAKSAQVAGQVGLRLAAFIAANPWILLIIVIVLLLILILLAFAGINANNSQSGYYDETCNYNLTTVNLNTCNTSFVTNISIQQYVIGTTLSLIKDKEYDDNTIKAIMITIKTNAFATGNYDANSKKLDLDTCTYGFEDNKDSAEYSKLITLYEEIGDYLYLNDSYNSTITNLSPDDNLSFDINNLENVQNEETTQSYNEILDNLFNKKVTLDNPTDETEEIDNKSYKLYSLGDYCEFIQTDENSNSSSMCATNSDSANIFTYISTFEGVTDACNGGTGYLAEDLKDGTITVGHGVTNYLLGNKNIADYIDKNGWSKYFRRNGNGYMVNEGDCIPTSVADKIKIYAIPTIYAPAIDTAAQKYGVTFTQYQKDALTSFNYNLGAGHTDSLVKAYADGGYEGLWNEMKQYVTSKGKKLDGLKKRRKSEFALFVTGDYTDQGKFYSRSLTNYDDYDSEGVLSRQAICSNGIGGNDSPNCTIYAQADPRWSSISLGGVDSMGRSGCAVTSIAIGISCSGVQTTISNFNAGEFIKKLNMGKCFVGNGSIIWGCSTITEVAPGVKFAADHNYIQNKSNEEKKQLINQYPQSNYFVLVHFVNKNYPRGHFVVVSSISGDNLTVKNPAGGVVSTIPINIIDRVLAYSTKG